MDEFTILMFLFLKEQPWGEEILEKLKDIIDKRQKKYLFLLQTILEEEDISKILVNLKSINKNLADILVNLYFTKRLSFFNYGFIIEQYTRLKDIVTSQQIEEFISIQKKLETELTNFISEKKVSDSAFSVLLLDKFQEFEEDNIIGLGLFTGIGGLSGAGKTTVASNLILDILKNNEDIYIHSHGTNEVDEFDNLLKIGSILFAENLGYLDKRIKKSEKELEMIKRKYMLINDGKNIHETLGSDIDIVINKIVKGTDSISDRIKESVELKKIIQEEIASNKKTIEKDTTTPEVKKMLLELIEEKNKLIDNENTKLEQYKELLEKFKKIKDANTQEKIETFRKAFASIIEEIKQKENAIIKMKNKFNNKIEILKKQNIFKRIKLFIHESKIDVETVEKELKKDFNKGRKVYCIIDYMQLLGTKKVFRNEVQEQEHIGMKLLGLSTKNKDKVGFLLFSQFKNKENGSGKPVVYTHDDVYGFKKITHNIGSFLTLENVEKNLDKKDIDHTKRPITHLMSSKNRFGDNWKHYYFSFVRNIGKLENINKNFYNTLKNEKGIHYLEDLMDFEVMNNIKKKNDENLSGTKKNKSNEGNKKDDNKEEANRLINDIPEKEIIEGKKRQEETEIF